MKFSRKNSALGVVSLLSFSLAATPLMSVSAFAADGENVSASAASTAFDASAAAGSLSGMGMAAVSQTLEVPDAPESLTLDLEGFDTAVAGVAGATATDGSSAGHNFDVEATIAAAYAEVGMSMPTGWSMPGECIAGAKRWILAGGGNWTGSGSPLANYVGATRVALSDAAPGDVIQYTYVNRPNAWVTGVHTVLITGANGDGTYSIVEQNNPAGSGLVSADDSWTPKAPYGFEAVAWRF